jgi:high-affinity nickel-transport protein
MAGSAAIALLVLATIRDATPGLVYLLCFGVGTIAGMVAVTVLLMQPLALLAARVGISRRWMAVASGLASLAVGVFLARSLGGANVLSAAAPALIAR